MKKTISTIEKVIAFTAAANIVREGLGVQGRSLYGELAKEVLAVKSVTVVIGKGKNKETKKVKVTLDNRTSVKQAIIVLMNNAGMDVDTYAKKVNTLATGVMRTAGMYRQRNATTNKMEDVKDVTKQKEQQKKDKSFDMEAFKAAVAMFKF